MNAYLWTSRKDAIVNSIRCKSPVSYLICHLTVSLSFLKNVIHFSFICQNIIEIWRFLLTVPGAVRRVSLLNFSWKMVLILCTLKH